MGGEPRDEAAAAIAELEQMDRGWYAGPVGWMDATEDGEFCVALRSALLRDRQAHLYAGGGIVADSDPAAELEETEIKLEALLPLVADEGRARRSVAPPCSVDRRVAAAPAAGAAWAAPRLSPYGPQAGTA